MTVLPDILTTADNFTEDAVVDDDELYCDRDPPERIWFTGVGTLIAVVGCFCNLLLLYVFVTRRTTKWSLYMMFLALLDFLLCFFFITCFGLLAVAVHGQITVLYDIIKDLSVIQFIMSRIVQVCIPYALITLSAERLGWLEGVRGWIVCLTMLIVWTTLRTPGYFALMVMSMGEQCDYFERRALTATDVASSTVYQWFDLVINFFHLFVSFVVLCFLNVVTVHRLRQSHRNARRHSSCPHVLLTTKNVAEREERREAKKLRCAIKTTIVVLSSYLICNSVNFVLYTCEMFFRWLITDAEGQFSFVYVVASDVGTNLFVLSSTVRFFIYYAYNPDVRNALRTLQCVRVLLLAKTTARDGKRDENGGGGCRRPLPLQQPQPIVIRAPRQNDSELTPLSPASV